MHTNHASIEVNALRVHMAHATDIVVCLNTAGLYPSPEWQLISVSVMQLLHFDLFGTSDSECSVSVP